MQAARSRLGDRERLVHWIEADITQADLPPGRYEYLLVADGEWMPDPLAKETVPNQFGGLNSVIRVPNGAANNAGKGLPNLRAE